MKVAPLLMKFHSAKGLSLGHLHCNKNILFLAKKIKKVVIYVLKRIKQKEPQFYTEIAYQKLA